MGKKGRTNAALTLGIIGTALGASYMQVTKFDIIHNTQYTDCKGNVRLVTEETSTILASPATSETITTLVPEVNKVIDVIIPNGVSIVNQAILDEFEKIFKTLKANNGQH